MKKFRKIPLGGILGELWDILGNFWNISKFYIFCKLKKILYEKKSE
jgi:hypothetical protein